jgi:hypothetical protein
MIDDMKACNLGTATEKSHIRSCRRFTAFLKRSPDRATADDVCAFQRLLPESGISIQQRNVIMTGVKLLLRVTRRRHDLAAEIFYLKQPRKMPLIVSREEVKRLLLMARSLEVRAMLALAYGCGLLIAARSECAPRAIDARFHVNIRSDQVKSWRSSAASTGEIRIARKVASRRECRRIGRSNPNRSYQPFRPLCVAISISPFKDH